MRYPLQSQPVVLGQLSFVDSDKLVLKGINVITNLTQKLKAKVIFVCSHVYVRDEELEKRSGLLNKVYRQIMVFQLSDLSDTAQLWIMLKILHYS